MFNLNFTICQINIIKALSNEQVMHSVAQQAINLLRLIFHTENQLKVSPLPRKIGSAETENITING